MELANIEKNIHDLSFDHEKSIDENNKVLNQYVIKKLEFNEMSKKLDVEVQKVLGNLNTLIIKRDEIVEQINLKDNIIADFYTKFYNSKPENLKVKIDHIKTNTRTVSYYDDEILIKHPNFQNYKVMLNKVAVKNFYKGKLVEDPNYKLDGYSEKKMTYAKLK